MVIYVPGTEETDPKKQNMSLQQLGGAATTNSTNIATNTANIATNTANIATITAAYVAGPASATANGFAVYNGTTGKIIKDHAATIALGSEVSGTLPVANGGTNYTGGAWPTFTPTITAGTGTFTTTSATGSFLQIGKWVEFTVTITITTVGTAATSVIMTLPSGTAVRPAAASGLEGTVSGKAVWGSVLAAGSTMTIKFYDNTFPGASGSVITITGKYEAS